jgi:rRNA-processing protein FCF1
MKFFVDTFSWKKIDILKELSLIDMDRAYDSLKICITHPVLTEISHFNLKSCILEKTQILPHQDNKLYRDALILGFDEADASLISCSNDEEEVYIVSEDRPLLTFGRSFGIKMVQLVDFMQVLTTLKVISKNNLYQINRKLREVKNISKRKEKSIKDWLKDF